MLRLFRRAQPTPKSLAPLRIGVVAARSGMWAVYGEAAVRGLELGLDYATAGTYSVAGRALRLLIEDDGGKEQKAQELATRLLKDEGCELLVGCTISQTSLQLVRVAQSLERLVLISVAATDVLTAEWFTPYMFRTAATTAQDAAAGGRYAAQHLGRRVAFISPDSLWGQQSRAAWWKVLAQQGADIVGDVLVPPQTTDFRPFLHDILSQRPDVLIAFWAGSLTRYLLTQMREVGLFEAMHVAGNLVDRETLHAVGLAPAGMVCAAKYRYSFPQNPINSWLVLRHQERYGEPPDLFSESGFTAGVALVEALKRSNGDARADVLIPVLEGLTFEGPKGQYTLRAQDHQALQPMYVAELRPALEGTVCEPYLLTEISAEQAAPPVAVESRHS